MIRGYKIHVFLLVILMMLVSALQIDASGKKQRPPFDPHRFQRDLEQFITSHAGLSPQEAETFFPIYRQLGEKQRRLFDEMNFYRFVNPHDNEASAKAIRRKDELDIQMRLLQQEYHNRFITILPAGKVMKILKAEEDFHREALKRMRR